MILPILFTCPIHALSVVFKELRYRIAVTDEEWWKGNGGKGSRAAHIIRPSETKQQETLRAHIMLKAMKTNHQTLVFRTVAVEI